MNQERALVEKWSSWDKATQQNQLKEITEKSLKVTLNPFHLRYIPSKLDNGEGRGKRCTGWPGRRQPEGWEDETQFKPCDKYDHPDKATLWDKGKPMKVSIQDL